METQVSLLIMILNVNVLCSMDTPVSSSLEMLCNQTVGYSGRVVDQSSVSITLPVFNATSSPTSSPRACSWSLAGGSKSSSSLVTAAGDSATTVVAPGDLGTIEDKARQLVECINTNRNQDAEILKGFKEALNAQVNVTNQHQSINQHLSHDRPVHTHIIYYGVLGSFFTSASGNL